MDDYSQPDFYRFNRDSLELVERVKASLDSCGSILDLGAGCGVLGLELANFYRPKILDLVELQEDFRPWLEENLRFVPSSTECRIFFKSFATWRVPQRYELIVCNPPYYLPGRGERSKDDRRAWARSFLRDDWVVLLNCIERCLALGGRCFIVVKNNKEILRTVSRGLGDTNLTMKLNSFQDLMFLELSFV